MQPKAIFRKIILYDCQTGFNCNVLHSAGFDCQMPKEVSCLFWQTIFIFKLPGSHFVITVETLMNWHRWDGKNLSSTGAGHLWECKNTEFVWELRIMVAVSRVVRLWECPLAEHPLHFRLPKCNFEKKSSQEHCHCHVLFFNSILKEKKISTTQENPLGCKTLKELSSCLSLLFSSTVPLQSYFM